MATDPKALRERATKVLEADHFGALGVTRTASVEEVEAAYLAAAKSLHPDRATPDLRPLFTKVFARLDLARTTLRDPALRARYVEELTRPASRAELAQVESALEVKKAEAMLKKSELDAAEAHLRRAVSLAPESDDARALLAFVQARPDTDDARLRALVADLDRVVARNERHERAIFFRAQLRRRLRDEAAAVRDFTRAAELNPSNVDAAREVRLHQIRSKPPVPERKPGLLERLFRRG